MSKTQKIGLICAAVIAGLVVMSVSFVSYRAYQKTGHSPVQLQDR